MKKVFGCRSECSSRTENTDGLKREYLYPGILLERPQNRLGK